MKLDAAGIPRSTNVPSNIWGLHSKTMAGAWMPLARKWFVRTPCWCSSSLAQPIRKPTLTETYRNNLSRAIHEFNWIILHLKSLKWIQIGTVASGPRCWCQAFSNSSNSCAFFARHRQARRRTAKSCPEPRNGHQRNHRQCVFERIPSDTTQTHHDEIASKEQRYFLFRPQVKGVKRHVGHVWARIPGFLYAPCMHAMSSVINNCWMMTPSRCQVTRKSIQETASLINVHP